MTNLEENKKNKLETSDLAKRKPSATPNRGTERPAGARGSERPAGTRGTERSSSSTGGVNRSTNNRPSYGGDRNTRANGSSAGSGVGGGTENANRQRRTFDSSKPRSSFGGDSRFGRNDAAGRRGGAEFFGKKEYFSEKKSNVKNEEQKLLNQENQKRKRDLNKSSMDALGIYATGRRKTSSARVWIKRGSGKFSVNNKSLQEYFKADLYNVSLFRPFEVTNTLNQFDVWCTAKGGGFTGQSDAIKLGIARALDIFNEDFRVPLKLEGLLTRDSRMVERKKYGKHGARKSTQFSKR
jgi:small subunit ribosomal protein S9